MTKSKSLRIQMVAAVTAMLLVSFMVVRTSSAAFTDSVDSSAQSFDSAKLVFDSAAPVTTSDISVTDLLPGDVETVCYEVAYGGTVLPSALELAGALTNKVNGTPDASTLAEDLGISGDTTTLDQHVQLEVLMGADTKGCADLVNSDGLLSGLLGGGTDYSTIRAYSDGTLDTFTSAIDLKAAGWTPSSTDTRAFVFNFQLPSDTGNTAQGDQVDVTFSWTAQQ